MTVQITIIGLGEIGGSFGLALNEQKSLLRRVGYDRDVKIARQAEKMGVVDRIETNLIKAVQDAEIILLCLPVDQIHEMIKTIAPVIKDGAVVMETGLAKHAASEWMEKQLPAGRFYVGLTPILNPAYLHGIDSGLTASRADLFKNGLMVIVAPGQIDTGAVKLASDLTRLVGSNPLFADSLEVDGLISATYLLPQLLAAALVNATSDQPGWREARKLAGRAYTHVSEPIIQPGNAAALSSAAILNQENLVRLLDSLSAALTEIRDEIDQGETEALSVYLNEARQKRLNWWNERQADSLAHDNISEVEFPEIPTVLNRLFGLGKKPNKDK